MKLHYFTAFIDTGFLTDNEFRSILNHTYDNERNWRPIESEQLRQGLKPVSCKLCDFIKATLHEAVFLVRCNVIFWSTRRRVTYKALAAIQWLWTRVRLYLYWKYNTQNSPSSLIFDNLNWWMRIRGKGTLGRCQWQWPCAFVYSLDVTVSFYFYENFSLMLNI